MAVGLSPPETLLPVAGVRIATAQAGIKKANRDDVTLFALDRGSVATAVFTRNAFCAAPVIVAREHLAEAQPRYLLINSGNANAGTGEAGLVTAKASCAAVAELGKVDTSAVLPFSTGVIGMPLPVDRIVAVLPEAMENLAEDHWNAACRAIMTTDTLPKGISKTLELDAGTVTITGIAKGAGMIRPDMATMLAFIATDAHIEPGVLQSCLQRAVDLSFNRISVDGDTSTNDSCVLVATGKGKAEALNHAKDLARFQDGLEEVCLFLAQAIVRDGEGATKFVTIEVSGGATEAEAEQVAYTVAHSPLVKTALFASDPNWGRILAAVGRAGLRDLRISGVGIRLDEVVIVEYGQPAKGYTEEAGAAVLANPEFTVGISLDRGEASATVWTCDFSYDYVRINAEYRS
ncbi:MAG: bifunctional glutamate N-acetyltransferase/amino-acid acetyltransferase ArgJ [Chromatiales bacterium]|nr:bifunctional glutamate N-acetyltransferase/amino-acid acetyltransferase ArgJ [Chromatiales bacterium]